MTFDASHKGAMENAKTIILVCRVSAMPVMTKRSLHCDVGIGGPHMRTRGEPKQTGDDRCLSEAKVCLATDVSAW